jgi:hypothetical protein
MPIPKISIPYFETAKDQLRGIENTINSLIDRINNTKPSRLDGMGNRVENVGRPASRMDAVPLGYLEEQLAGFTGGNNRRLDVTTTTNQNTIILSDEIIITKV